MMKQNKWKLLISSAVILLPMLAGVILWNKLPAKVPTHWGFDGTVDGWGSKAFAVFGLPLILLATHWICVFVTSLDPKNKGQSQKVFGLILWICPLVSLFVGVSVYAGALGVALNVGALAMWAMALMFIVIGNYLPKCKQNYTVGIKVPWTLESEENWNATHRFGGKVWVMGGALIALCAFLPRVILFPVFLVLLTVLVFLPILYSYLYYRKHR